MFLNISREEATERLKKREGHYMKANMVDSQLAALEPPDPAVDQRMLIVDGALPPSELIATIAALD